MKFHKQTQLYNPDDDLKTGNCYPTVIACLLDVELDQVPFFNLLFFEDNGFTGSNIDLYLKEKYLGGKEYESAEDYQKENYDNGKIDKNSLWYQVLNMFLASRGYCIDYIADVDKFLKENPGVPYMASGMSARGVSHIVIYKDGKPYHDPHPSNSFLNDGQRITFKGLFPLSDLNSHKYYMTS